MFNFQRLFSLGLSFSALAVAQSGQLDATWRVDVGEALYPEGIAYDAVRNRIVLSSLTSPLLATFDPSNDMALLSTYARNDEMRSCFGLAMDPTTEDRVWCAEANLGTLDNGRVVAYDIPMDGSTASSAAEHAFPCTGADDSGCGAANDVVFGANQVAYVTDTGLGKVYSVDRQTGAAIEEVVSDPLLVSVDPPFGANGVVHHSNGFLIVGNYGNQTLLRVDLETRTVVQIEVDAELGNPDGLLLLEDGRLVVVTGTTVFVLSDASNDWTQASVDDEIDIDRSGEGEIATTAAIGATPLEAYITYVRFGELFEQNTNVNASLVGRVVFAEASAYTADDPDSKAPQFTGISSLVLLSTTLICMLANFF